jgi:hypothetical protein
MSATREQEQSDALQKLRRALDKLPDGGFVWGVVQMTADGAHKEYGGAGLNGYRLVLFADGLLRQASKLLIAEGRPAEYIAMVEKASAALNLRTTADPKPS